MNRPKSTSDAHTLAKPELESIEEPLSSPTKGILLTPGAAAARKKNVSFGANVVDNEEKRPMKSGLPDDCPGKFPSPWVGVSSDTRQRDGSPDKARGRNKLTEALEQVRDDSRKRKSKGDNNKQIDDDELIVELGGDHKEPRSADGKYWKREYDIYRTNTQREVKKLITKQKAAKSFAQMKDTQCTDLADQLRQEQKKVEKLEAKTAELASLVWDLQAKLQNNQDEDMKQPGEVAITAHPLEIKNVPKGGRSNSMVNSAPISPLPEPRIGYTRTKSLDGKADELMKPARLPSDGANPQADPVQRPSEPYLESNPSTSPKLTARSIRARSKSYQEDVQLKSTDDIWAHLDSSSNPVVSQLNNAPQSTNGGLAVTSGTEATPLQALNINTLPTGPYKRRGGSPQSMDVECKSTPDLERVDSKNSPGEENPRRDSPLSSSALPQSATEPNLAAAPGRAHASTQRQDIGSRANNRSSQILESSPFQHVTKDLPPLPDASMPQPFSSPKVNISNNTKENISPTTKSYTTQDDLQAKPSAVWSSMHPAQPGKRNPSIAGKDGKELSDDRIAAARARIAARGRVTS